jgi:hypothetical protein
MSFLKSYAVWLVAFNLLLTGCKNEPEESIEPVTLQLVAATVGPYNLDVTDFSKNNEAPTDKPLVVSFTAALNMNSASQAIQLKLKNSGEIIPITLSFLDGDKTVSAQSNALLLPNLEYQLIISGELKGANGEKFPGYTISFKTIAGSLHVTSLLIDDKEVLTTTSVAEVPVQLSAKIKFNAALNPAYVSDQYFKIYLNGAFIPVTVSSSTDNSQVTIVSNQKLGDFKKYQLWISGEVKGASQEKLQTFIKDFYTGADITPDFPVISDAELLTIVQQQTFKYFYDFAHPSSGMARERNTSGDVVTTGGTGFGIMTLIVGIERGFITRSEGLAHFEKILSFLESADKFHGAWSHWVNGSTGKVVPFGANDNGGDLVETSFLVQGLLTFRQYLDAGVTSENALIGRINLLWQAVEWDWYTKGGQNVLYWHWSPDKEWIMNHQIKGYNEALITYVLAASSPAHPITSGVYHQGWASNGAILNGKNFYGITLPVGDDYGGPLFFSHYSFLGLDPRNLNDMYADYWKQNLSHSLINHAYSVDNPRNYIGYSDQNWGLTASDSQNGYSAHSPTNDLGVISPTAALSSFPYSPVESMKALKFFYYNLGDRLWGPYGFYDAFNLTEGWVASSYLAIDQGPIVVMIENHRSGLLWNLFMSAPEVKAGLTKLSFTY